MYLLVIFKSAQMRLTPACLILMHTPTDFTWTSPIGKDYSHE